MTKEKLKYYEKKSDSRTDCRLKGNHMSSLCKLKTSQGSDVILSKCRTQGIRRGSNHTFGASGLHRIQGAVPKSLLHPEDEP